MHANSSADDTLDLASVAGALGTGLSTLVIQLFPFAMPLLLLTVVPLVVLGMAVAVLALPVVLPLLLGRLAFRALRRERKPGPGVHAQRSRLAQ
jgi:hypothetical protein